VNKEYCVYILTNKSRTLYTGVTGDLEGRIWQHKQAKGSVFTSKYKINRLVYYETYSDVMEAITREKQIKGWLRVKKIALVESINPDWDDMAANWFEE
jgi:putative endonuclease